jgi:hypothetical protein
MIMYPFMHCEAGLYEGGTAIIDNAGAAFWVKDGKGYVVNELAREAAPELPRAPDDITYDDAFIAAALAED